MKGIHWVAAGLLASVAATAGAQSIPGLPAFTAAYEPSTVDERGLWMEADEDERGLRDSPLVIRDEKLREYVHGVLCRTVGDDRCAGVRIYLVEVPAFNASMAPNGTMRVWTGLLLRVRNEAELASVLGHEFAHFELRHTLRQFKHDRTASDLLAWVSVLGGLSNTNTSFAQWALIGSVFHFSRAQEQEADLLSFKYLARSPYSTAAPASIWLNVMAEEDATALGRKRRTRQHYAAGFFASHPTELTRATYLAKEAQAVGIRGETRTDAYRQAIAPIFPRLMGAQLKLNDFGGTEYIITQLAKEQGWTGDLLYSAGELYRTRGNPRDLATAATYYERAIQSGYAGADARRNLGLALVRNGEIARGKAALGEYLKSAPDAPDASAISMIIDN